MTEFSIFALLLALTLARSAPRRIALAAFRNSTWGAAAETVVAAATANTAARRRKREDFIVVREIGGGAFMIKKKTSCVCVCATRALCAVVVVGRARDSADAEDNRT